MENRVIAFDVGNNADITLSAEGEQYVLRWSEGEGKVFRRNIQNHGEAIAAYFRKRKALKIETFAESI